MTGKFTTELKKLNNLLFCPRCQGATPRDCSHCVWQCGYRLNEKELRGIVKDNSPQSSLVAGVKRK